MRLSTLAHPHGLSVQVSYTFQKELTSGANSDTSYLTPNPPLINDVFNRAQQKQISSFGRPHVLVVSFNYTTPGFNSSNGSVGGLRRCEHLFTIRFHSWEIQIRTPNFFFFRN